MPILNHEHSWRWNEWYISDGGDPVHCGKYDRGYGIPRKCSAKLTMQELIERAQKVERVMWAYRQGTVEAGIEVMAWVGEWDAEREST